MIVSCHAWVPSRIASVGLRQTIAAITRLHIYKRERTGPRAPPVRITPGWERVCATAVSDTHNLAHTHAHARLGLLRWTPETVYNLKA